MIPGTDQLRRYIRDHLHDITDRQILMDLFIICLKFRGMPYTKYRTAQIRNHFNQYKLFDGVSERVRKEGKSP